ncbi:hypothetical protein CDD83_3367 [Cordyceps sp. RAO-2017]|nr:hypothetical protein CDD83_3367 [Cordyceps sp. RAO-2017]
MKASILLSCVFIFGPAALASEAADAKGIFSLKDPFLRLLEGQCPDFKKECRNVLNTRSIRRGLEAGNPLQILGDIRKKPKASEKCKAASKKCEQSLFKNRVQGDDGDDKAS